MYNFVITEPLNMKSLIYVIKEKDSDYKLKEVKSELVNIQGFEIEKEYRIKKYLDVENDSNLIILNIWDDKVSVNAGLIKNDSLKISNKPKGIKYEKIDSSDLKKSLKLKYKSNEDKKVFIIDLETGKEINSNGELTSDEIQTCNITPGKKYLAIEYRHGTLRVLAVGICKFENENGKLAAVMTEQEARRIDYGRILEEISKGNYKEIMVEKQVEREL